MMASKLNPERASVRQVLSVAVRVLAVLSKNGSGAA